MTIPKQLNDNNDQLLSKTEAAKFLGVSPMTVHRKYKNDEIGYYKIGNRILFSLSNHLLPFLQRCEHKVEEV